MGEYGTFKDFLRVLELSKDEELDKLEDIIGTIGDYEGEFNEDGEEDGH